MAWICGHGRRSENINLLILFVSFPVNSEIDRMAWLRFIRPLIKHQLKLFHYNVDMSR